MHDTARLANLLGAAALGVSELMLSRVRAASGVSTSGAAALVVLAHAPRISVTELGRSVGLSQSAAARMVDALVAGGLVCRCPEDGKAVPVELTPAGRDAVRGVLAARVTELTELLSDFDDDEGEALSSLLEKLLARLFGDVGSSAFLCRLCDRSSCVESAPCPVGRAERERGA